MLYSIKIGSQTQTEVSDSADSSEATDSSQNVTVSPSHSMHRLIPSVPDNVYLANVTTSESHRNTSLPKSANQSRFINTDEDGFKPFRPSQFLGTSEPYYVHRRDVVHKNRIQFNDKLDSVHSSETENLYHQEFPLDYKHYPVNQGHAPAVVEPTPDGPEASKQQITSPYWQKTPFGPNALLKNKKPIKFEENIDDNDNFENSPFLQRKIPFNAAALFKNKKPLKFEDSFHIFDHPENSPLLEGKTPASATTAELLNNKKPIKFEENLGVYGQLENTHLFQNDDFKYPYFVPVNVHPTTEATKQKPEVKVYEHKHAIKGLLQLAATLIPIGLFVAALQPTVIQVNSSQPTDKKPGKFRSLEPAEISLLNSLPDYGLGTTDNPECDRKLFCQYVVSGSTAQADSVQRTLWHLLTRSPSAMPSSLYLSDLFKAVRTNECHAFKCDKTRDSATNSTLSIN